jgi:hypothetical protein
MERAPGFLEVSHGRLYLPYFISRCSDTVEDHPTAPPCRATGLPIQPIPRQNTLVDAADKENSVEPVEAEWTAPEAKMPVDWVCKYHAVRYVRGNLSNFIWDSIMIPNVDHHIKTPPEQ